MPHDVGHIIAMLLVLITIFFLNFQEQNAEVNSVSEKLVENLRLIWENFL